MQTNTPVPSGNIDTKILALYMQRKRSVMDVFGTVFSRISALYDLFRNYYRGKHSQYRNVAQLPFVFSGVESDVCRKTMMTFSSWPIVDFVGTSAEDAPIARRNATLISTQLENDNSFLKAVDFYLSADIYGTAIAEVGWRTDTRYEKQRVPVFDELTGREDEQIVEGWVTRFDGPCWEVVDILDFWPQPGKKFIEEMDWCMRRFIKDLDWVKVRSRRDPVTGAPPLFDAFAVSRLEQRALVSTVVDEISARRNAYRSLIDYNARASDSYARPVTLVNMIGEVPEELAPDGVRWRIITIANDAVILRNRPFPFHHGRLNFVAYCPMPDPHFFHGIGKAEIAYKMAALANRIASQKADATDLAVEPAWLVNRMAGIDTQNLVLRSGRIIGVDGPVDDSIIRPVQMDLRGFAVAHQEIGQYKDWILQSMGLTEDTLMGMPGPSRETARGFLGRQEGALTRVSCEARLAEKAIEKMADMIRANDQQFLTLPHMVDLIGSEATINPITGLPLPQEPTIITLSDLVRPCRARALGASQILGRTVRRQDLRELTTLLQTNPIALQVMNWAAWLRYIFRTYELPNVDEFLVQNVPQISKVADETKQSPEELLQQAGQATDEQQIPPELLQQLMAGGGTENYEPAA